MLFQGSSRNKNNCPGEDGKTHSIVNWVADHLEGVDVDVCDLSVTKEQIIMPCKGCVSTAGGYHCHFPCSCYGPGSGAEGVPDYLHDAFVYNRLQEADGFILYTPIYWYSVPTQVKALFDRLVCVNMTLTKDFAWNKAGIKKNPKKSRSLSIAGTYDDKLQNHLAGKVAGFYIHGDNGADDYQRPKTQDDLPSASVVYDEEEAGMTCPLRTIDPIVWQCRYSGIHVPEDLIYGYHMNEGLSYAEANDVTAKQQFVYDNALELANKVVAYIKAIKEAGVDK